MNQPNSLDNRDINNNYEVCGFFYLNASLMLGVELRSMKPSVSW